MSITLLDPSLASAREELPHLAVKFCHLGPCQQSLRIPQSAPVICPMIRRLRQTWTMAHAGKLVEAKESMTPFRAEGIDTGQRWRRAHTSIEPKSPLRPGPAKFGSLAFKARGLESSIRFVNVLMISPFDSIS